MLCIWGYVPTALKTPLTHPFLRNLILTLSYRKTCKLFKNTFPFTLLHALNDLLFTADSGAINILTLLVFNAAFNMINHKTLISCLLATVVTFLAFPVSDLFFFLLKTNSFSISKQKSCQCYCSCSLQCSPRISTWPTTFYTITITLGSHYVAS